MTDYLELTVNYVNGLEEFGVLEGPDEFGDWIFFDYASEAAVGHGDSQEAAVLDAIATYKAERERMAAKISALEALNG